MLLNYAFGLTRVKAWKYVLLSWIGMLPGTIMYVYLGSTLRQITKAAVGEVSKNPAARIFFWVGLPVAIIVAVVVTRVARKALKNTLPTPPEQHEQEA